jgi:hypothetical protein
VVEYSSEVVGIVPIPMDVLIGQCSLVHHFVYFIGNQVVAVFCFFVSVVAKARGQERILLNDLVHVVDIIVGVMRYVGGFKLDNSIPRGVGGCGGNVLAKVFGRALTGRAIRYKSSLLVNS